MQGLTVPVGNLSQTKVPEEIDVAKVKKYNEQQFLMKARKSGSNFSMSSLETILYDDRANGSAFFDEPEIEQAS